MFDISAAELTLIAVVALVVVGPKHLTEYSRKAGRLLSQLKGAKQSFLAVLDEEAPEVREAIATIKDATSQVEGMAKDMQSDVAEATGEVQRPPSPAPEPTGHRAPTED